MVAIGRIRFKWLTDTFEGLHIKHAGFMSIIIIEYEYFDENKCLNILLTRVLYCKKKHVILFQKHGKFLSEGYSTVA